MTKALKTVTPSTTSGKLRQLADFIERLEPGKFYFGSWVSKSRHGCGTVCCAAGWIPAAFPDSAEARLCWGKTRGQYLEFRKKYAEDFLELDAEHKKHAGDLKPGGYTDFNRLFLDLDDVLKFQALDRGEYGGIPAPMVAKRLREFADAYARRGR